MAKRGLKAEELRVLREIRLRGSLGYPVYSHDKKAVGYLIKRGYATMQTTGFFEHAYTTHEGNVVLADKGPFVVEAEVAFSFAQGVDAKLRALTDAYYPGPLMGGGVAFPHVWQTAVRYALLSAEVVNQGRSHAGTWATVFRWASSAVEHFCSGNHVEATNAVDMIDYWGREVAKLVEADRARYAAEEAKRNN